MSTKKEKCLCCKEWNPACFCICHMTEEPEVPSHSQTESIEWEKECCCGKNGICKSLGDTLKLILEVHWEDREKLKELDNVIREHIASAVEARESNLYEAVKNKKKRWHIQFENTEDPVVNDRSRKYNDEVSGYINYVLDDVLAIINPSKE